jgi:hypothetical protein
MTLGDAIPKVHYGRTPKSDFTLYIGGTVDSWRTGIPTEVLWRRNIR